MDFWVTLWTVLLWTSTVAFGLVSLYIVAGALKKILAASMAASSLARQPEKPYARDGFAPDPDAKPATGMAPSGDERP